MPYCNLIISTVLQGSYFIYRANVIFVRNTSTHFMRSFCIVQQISSLSTLVPHNIHTTTVLREDT